MSFYLPLILTKLPTTPLQRFECHHYNEKFYVFSRNLNRILIPRAKTEKINEQCLLNTDLLIFNSYRFGKKRFSYEPVRILVFIENNLLEKSIYFIQKRNCYSHRFIWI